MNNLSNTSQNAMSTQQNRRGFEDTDSDDELIIPRVRLIQKTSPELEDEEFEHNYNFSPKPGMILNSITKEQLPSEFTPILKWTEFIKFNPQDPEKPGFDPEYKPGQIIWKTKDRNDPRCQEAQFGEDGSKPTAVKVLSFLCFFEGQNFPLVLGFSKTSFAAGKKLNTLSKLAGGDRFAFSYRLFTQKKENNAGQSYFVFDIAQNGKTSDENFAICEQMHESFLSMNFDTHEEEINDSEVNQPAPF